MNLLQICLTRDELGDMLFLTLSHMALLVNSHQGKSTRQKKEEAQIELGFIICPVQEKSP